MRKGGCDLRGGFPCRVAWGAPAPSIKAVTQVTGRSGMPAAVLRGHARKGRVRTPGTSAQLLLSFLLPTDGFYCRFNSPLAQTS